MKSKIQVLKEEIFKIILILMILVPILTIGVLEISSGSMYVNSESALLNTKYWSEGDWISTEYGEDHEPSLTVEISAPNTTNSNRITFNIQFSEKIDRDLVVGNFNINGGDVILFNTVRNKYQYELVVSPKDDSENVSVSLNAGLCMSAYDKSDYNSYANKIVKIDRENPTLTSITTNVNDPTSSSSIKYTFSFSEPVDGFDENDIVVDNGTMAEFIKESETTYSLVVENSESCLQTVRVADDSYTDKAGNYGRGASKSITVDRLIEFTIEGNPLEWTNEDVTLNVSSKDDLNSIVVNGEMIDGTTYTVKENGKYTFIITDTLGNEETKIVEVTKIDKETPSITDVVVDWKNINIKATDLESGIKEYAVTSTKATPEEWQTTSTFKVSDGNYYAWVKDNVGNIIRKETTVTVDTPTISININGSYNGDVIFYHKVSGSDEYVKLKDFSDKYLKYGDTLRAEVEINNYLFTGLENDKEVKLSDILNEEGKIVEEVSKEIYPALTIGNYYFTPVSATQTEDKVLTKLVYEFTSSDPEQEEILNPVIKIDLTKNMKNEDLHMYYSDDYNNFNTGDKIKSVASRNIKVHIDGIPYVTAESYVEEKTASGRYPEGTPIVIEVTSSEELKTSINPELKVSFSESGLGKYNYQEDSTKGNAKLFDTYVDENGKTIWVYSYIVQVGDEGTIIVEYVSGSITDLAENTVDISTLEKEEEKKVYADTTAPTVKITAQKLDGQVIANNITNADKIRYALTFSEAVVGFTADDIIVNGGTKGELSNVTVNSDGTYSYTIDVIPAVEEGNYGKVQLIVESGVCKGLLGIENVRNENTIIIDRKAPSFVSSEVDCDDKEFYKSGDKLTVIAVFDENIASTEIIPELELTFSDTGIAKGTLSEGKKVGNTITWEYTISKQDSGELIIKKLIGTVVDLAGNETVVNKKNLEDYGVTVDNMAPKATIVYNTNDITNKDVTATITFNEDVIITNNDGKNTYVFTKNEEFTFEFKDLAGNTATATAVVTTIDKTAPEGKIEYTINNNGNVIAKISFNEEDVTITNNDGKNAYTFTENGEFTFEFKDLAGNVGTATAVVTTMDKTAPEGKIEYTTNKDGSVTAKITFNEENVIITNNNGKDTYTFTKNGEFTFEFKDSDENTGSKKAVVDNISETEDPDVPETPDGEIIFEDLVTIQVNGTKYVKVTSGMSAEEIIDKMVSTELVGETPEITNLTNEGTLKTGSEIKLNGETKYTVVLKGDLNGDGRVDFIGDVILANNYRIGQVDLTSIQELAADINNSGTIDFIQDIIAMNNYRLGIINSL